MGKSLKTNLGVCGFVAVTGGHIESQPKGLKWHEILSCQFVRHLQITNADLAHLSCFARQIKWLSLFTLGFEKYTHKVKYVIVLLQSSNHDAIIDVNVTLTFPLKKGIAIWRLSFALKGFVECLCCAGSWSSIYSSGLTIATVALFVERMEAL